MSGAAALPSPALRCDQAAAWKTLSALAAQGAGQDLRAAFDADSARAQRLTLDAPGIHADLSKNLVNQAVLDALLALAEQTQVCAWRDAMFAGLPINQTEDRAVLHTALRAPLGQAPYGEQVAQVLERVLAYAEQVRDVARSGIRDVVNIGIGGSDLGPQMVALALDAHLHPGLRLHFVSNVDGQDLASVLRDLSPQHTLFVIASKTFTTQETMANAHTARAWFLACGGQDIARHFVGATTNLEAAAAFGIATTFGFWDWVGGRYSLWSAIGLPLAIGLGGAGFRALLAGAHAMDGHFREASPERNLPLMLGLLDVWYRNFMGCTSRSIAPYHQGLRRLPAFLQQLEMESNGKGVDRSGRSVAWGTAPVVWGEPGTNGQHAFFQMLHQGTDIIPVEFLLICEGQWREPVDAPWPDDVRQRLQRQHRLLQANALAQAQALMQGKSAQAALAEQAPTAGRQIAPGMLAQHRSFPGNRPSSVLMLDRLDPYTMGSLLAMYEHRVFTSGAVWGINSFDQWGVELGKALCAGLLPRLDSGDVHGLDGSTAALLTRMRSAWTGG